MSGPVVNNPVVDAWLNENPHVRAMIPTWAEVVEAEYEDGIVCLYPGIIRGETEAANSICVSADGRIEIENPTIYLPSDRARWEQSTPQQLVERVRHLSADLASIAEALEASR